TEVVPEREGVLFGHLNHGASIVPAPARAIPDEPCVPGRAVHDASGVGVHEGFCVPAIGVSVGVSGLGVAPEHSVVWAAPAWAVKLRSACECLGDGSGAIILTLLPLGAHQLGTPKQAVDALRLRARVERD